MPEATAYCVTEGRTAQAYLQSMDVKDDDAGWAAS
jgi:hypothetical protein